MRKKNEIFFVILQGKNSLIYYSKQRPCEITFLFDVFLRNHLNKLSKTSLELFPFKIISKSLSVYPRYTKFLSKSRSYKKHEQCRHEQFLVLIVWIFKNLLLWSGTKILNDLWICTNKCVLDPLKKIVSLSYSSKKYGCHVQLLFLIGWNFKKSFPLKLQVQMIC